MGARLMAVVAEGARERVYLHLHQNMKRWPGQAKPDVEARRDIDARDDSVATVRRTGSHPGVTSSPTVSSLR